VGAAGAGEAAFVQTTAELADYFHCVAMALMLKMHEHARHGPNHQQ